MMAQFPCLPLWTDAWLADTDHLGEEELGAYIRLLVLMWRTPHCRVPDDNGWLQRHLRCNKERVRDLYRPIVEEFCRIEGGFIVQRRLQKEFVATFEFKKRMSDWRKRHRNKKKDLNSGSQSPVDILPTPTHNKET